ncbi:phage head morphogenesis protein [Neisseria subflava]|uniref:phage head morphogenesis protein n=1 Tax=Neisseria subflava TaxID=28449 RepID=UPI0027E06759|nr:phage minor head protein [Neisseria subflava]
MGANQVDLAYAFGLPPERAIRYFETLGYTVPTDWPQRMQQAAAKAQTIAGIYRQDVVADIHRALGESAAKGTPFAKFRDAVERQLTAKGLHLDQAGDMVDTATGELLGKGITPQRLEVIYRTNMQNAYMAGRWQELQDNRAAMPYLQYTAVMDNRTRPLHRELHGQVYHIDDPFWDTFYPPNGFNCRCTVTAYSAADLTRRGLEVSDSEGRLEEVYRVVNKAGDTEPTRAIRLADGRSFMADRGFDGNVGKRHLAQLGQLQMQRAVDLPPRLASMSVNQALDNLILRRAVADDLYQAYQKLMTANRPQNQPAFVGAVSLHTLDELARRQLPLPQSAIIASSDSLVRHAQRSVKAGVDKTLPADFWQRLPDHIRQPLSIYFEAAANAETNPSLLYFYADPTDADYLYKLVVQMDYDGFRRSKNPTTGKRENLIVNVVDTGTRIKRTGTDWSKYVLLHGQNLK